MKPPTLIPIAFVLFLLPGLSFPAADPKIYENAYNWAHPNEVKVEPEELLIRMPDSPYYRALSDEKIPLQSVEAPPQRFLVRFANGEVQEQNGEQWVRLTLPDFSCDLRIRSILAPCKPGDGYAYYGPGKDKYLQLVLSAPSASVSGEMSIHGRTIQADGWCTASRSLSVLPLSKLNTRYFGWQAFSPDSSQEPWYLELHHYEAQDGQNPLRIPMLILAHGSRFVLTTKEAPFEPNSRCQQ